ncbi:MAG: hypothetical protein M1820_005967 [Bogoriella megaspora]|nr:MAG: hypothetical protein M1820_005967 [Bogoriella megaspora]
MQLSWQPGYSLSKKPTRGSSVRRARRIPPEDTGRPQRFEFISERPVRNHDKRRRRVQSVNTFPDPKALAEPGLDCQASSTLDAPNQSVAGHSKNKPTNASTKHGASRRQGGAFEEAGTPTDALQWALTSTSLPEAGGYPYLETIDGTTECLPCNGEDRDVGLHLPGSATNRRLRISKDDNIEPGTCYENSSELGFVETTPILISDLSNIWNFSSVSVPPSVTYSSLSQKYSSIFARYDQEFCKIPLTPSISDLRINPFRCPTDLESRPAFLVHAVMALAGHHVHSTSTQDHRHTALQLLRGSLDKYNSVGNGYSMLDTITILFSLDETQSNLGNWSTHLVGAYNVLEACGGIEAWATSARVKAQVGMLTWWDAILSLVSREDCVFPYAYFEAVLSSQDDRQWDYFGLCGCPKDLVILVMRLARVSAEKRKSASMQYVTFDASAITEIEHALESWYHVPAANAFRDEESMQQDQDTMHCSEAWRNGLLLYIYRVFQWEPGNSIPMHVLYRARVILDHVFACRDDIMVPRQALLPLFFAGCELGDHSSRKKITKFCSAWDERTRYHVFGSTIPLLEEVWAAQEALGLEDVWWGQVVDQRHTYASNFPLRMRICFG